MVSFWAQHSMGFFRKQWTWIHKKNVYICVYICYLPWSGLAFRFKTLWRSPGDKQRLRRWRAHFCNLNLRWSNHTSGYAHGHRHTRTYHKGRAQGYRPGACEATNIACITCQGSQDSTSLLRLAGVFVRRVWTGKPGDKGKYPNMNIYI